MTVEIYVDVLFFINFIMDYFILWTVGKLVKKRVPFKRLVLGAFLGAFLLCLLIFLPFLNRAYNILGFVVLAMVLVMVTYVPRNLREFIKLLVLVHITAFGIGGTGIALFYFTNIGYMFTNMVNFEINNFSFKILIISTAMAYIIIKLTWGWIGKHVLKQQLFYPIKIYFDGNQADATALVDTGNSLYDPFTHNPVIIVEFYAIESFLPEEIKSIYKEKKENDLEKLTQIFHQTSIGTRIRMIPFSSLGMPNGMLIGFRPDQVEVFNEDKDHAILKNVIIGIYNYKLSSDNAYQALLHPDALQNTI